MSQAIDDLQKYQTADCNADQIIRMVLETHLHYLRNHSDTRVVVIDHGQARPFYYNLYAYLFNQGYDPKLYWLIMQLSDIANQEAFDQNTTSIRVPGLGIVEEILAMANG